MLSFQNLFPQLSGHSALKQGLETLSWDVILHAVKIIFMIWIDNTLIYFLLNLNIMTSSLVKFQVE